MSDARIKKHPYFSMIDWEFVRSKRYIAPFSTFTALSRPLIPSYLIVA